MLRQVSAGLGRRLGAWGRAWASRPSGPGASDPHPSSRRGFSTRGEGPEGHGPKAPGDSAQPTQGSQPSHSASPINSTGAAAGRAMENEAGAWEASAGQAPGEGSALSYRSQPSEPGRRPTLPSREEAGDDDHCGRGRGAPAVAGPAGGPRPGLLRPRLCPPLRWAQHSGSLLQSLALCVHVRPSIGPPGLPGQRTLPSPSLSPPPFAFLLSPIASRRLTPGGGLDDIWVPAGAGVEEFVLEAEGGRKVGLAVYNGPSRDSTATDTGSSAPSNAPIFWVFYFHDAPGSRLDLQMFTQTAFAPVIKRLKIAVVSVDRPGYGNSDPNPDASFLSHANDVLGIAEFLGVRKFSLLGLGVGAAYAEACAHYLPSNRISGLGVMGGIGPYPEADFPLRPPHAQWFDGSWKEELYRRYLLLYRLFVFSRLYPRYGVEPHFAKPKTPEDKLLGDLSKPSFFTGAMYEAYKNTAGILTDQKLTEMQPWGFSLSQIPVERVLIVHDSNDSVVPVAASRYAHKQIPHSLLKRAREGGHYFFYQEFEKVLIALTGGRPWYEALAPPEKSALLAAAAANTKPR